ncbi:MAG: hypothetical protein ACKVQC_01830 [Elusimicrobiota bacterium]
MENNETASAQAHLTKAIELKASHQWDAALTEFRRAALMNPKLFEAQLEIGRMCWDKAKTDPLFYKHSFEAFRQASRLNLSHDEAHQKYISTAQKLNRLDELLEEYSQWIEENPNNTNLEKAKKTIIAISMALIPDKVNVTEAKASSGLSKFLFFFSICNIVSGLGIILLAPFIPKLNIPMIGPQHIPMLIKSGIWSAILGAIGMILRSRIK